MTAKNRHMGTRRIGRRRAENLPTVVPEHIDRSILVVRGQKVLLDRQLAGFYGVPTKRLVEAVKRNLARFPDDFMFQLTADEWSALRSQIATLDVNSPSAASRPSRGLRSQIVALKTGRGRHPKYLPYAFTEQGVAMLSGILRSPRAVEVNIQIMRAFVRLRQLLALHKELAQRLAKLEARMRRRDRTADRHFRQIFALLDQLFNPPDPPRRPIGFHTECERAGEQGISHGTHSHLCHRSISQAR